MGADQAAETLLALQLRDAKRSGKSLTKQETDELHQSIYQLTPNKTDIRYGAARGWVDAINSVRMKLCSGSKRTDLLPATSHETFRTGVLQV